MSQVTALQKVEEFSKEQMELITQTIAKGATPNELKLFLYRCKQYGLDPLKVGQVHFIKYGANPGSVVIGIDGFRAIAARTNKVSGIRRGVIKDEKGKLVGAWAEVHRKDWTHPAREEVPFSEYDTGRGTWSEMPETMIKKVAECAALRMAFPDNLGGMYSIEESEKSLESAEKNAGKILPQAPGENDGVIHQGYMCPGHLDPRIAGRTIGQCDPSVLRDVVIKIESKYAALKKPVPAKGQEFIAEAEKAIAAWENGNDAEEESDEDAPF